MEIWKQISNFAGYEISSTGQLRNIKTGHIRKPTIRHGYNTTSLSKNGKMVIVYYHRLVCEAFHGPSPWGKNQVAHYDGNRTNNFPENLRWTDHKGNAQDTMRCGTKNPQRGSKHSLAKLTEKDVREIRSANRKLGVCIELAKRYNVSVSTIRALRTASYPGWPHVRD